uniref:Uncharacterized protein n=1 Tax=Tetradesmus obliquus TaxID=3088 RepID=A0A383VU45_TETOB|eukprot:jgi/Sobl393_1/18118/SZX68721.1
MAAAAEPAPGVEAATFKQCPRACRNQRIDTATYCRTCSACAGYKKRCAGCSGLPRPTANAAWPQSCLAAPVGMQCTAQCSAGFAGTVTSTCTSPTAGHRNPKKPYWSPPSGSCIKAGCTTAAQCPTPANGKPLCLSGRCDIACNDNFIKTPDAAGTGFFCKAVEPTGSMTMPGKFGVWVGGFSSIAGWDGSQWEFRYPDATVTGLALASDSYAVAVGGPNYYIFNNGVWTAYRSPAYLYGATTGVSQFWMVGAQGTVWNVEADFTQFSNQVPGVNTTLISVAEVRPTVAVAVGEAGTIVNLNGRDPAAWKKEQSGTQQNLNYVVAAAGAAWVVGDSGTILYNSGSSGGWVSQKSGTTKHLYGITVVSSTLAWAVGASGTILKYDGSSWSSVGPITDLGLYAVYAWSPTAAMAFGQNSVVLSYDGTKWTVASNPGIGSFYTVAVLPEGSSSSEPRGSGRKLLQSSIPEPPGQGGFTPSISTCASTTQMVEITDPAYISPSGEDLIAIPTCPGDGSNLLRCKAAGGGVLCDQNGMYESCQWTASGGSVSSGSGKCPKAGPYCGVIAGDKPRLNALAGIAANPIGTGYKFNGSQGQFLLDTEAKFPPCARPGQRDWPEAEPDNVKEKRILLESKSILVGDASRPNATLLATWNASTNPCGSGTTQPWEGISCGKSGRNVEGIELPGGFKGSSCLACRLQGKLPDSWSQLSRLISIELPGNNLDGTLPSSWNQLTKLVKVVVSGNQGLLGGQLPATWSNLTNLAIVNLAGCQFRGPLPDAWSKLRCFTDVTCRPTGDAQRLNISVSAIDLSGNRLIGPIPPSWAGMANLAKLNLRGNKLTGPLPSFFGDMPYLTELMLSTNQFTGNLPANWANMGSAMRGATGVAELGFLSMILQFAENQISGSVPASWANMDPKLILAVSLFKNADLGGCLPKAWFNRYRVVQVMTPLGPMPMTQKTQMFANEDPTDIAQPEQVSCIAFTPGQCDPFISPELKADSGVLDGTKITGWCP